MVYTDKYDAWKARIFFLVSLYFDIQPLIRLYIFRCRMVVLTSHAYELFILSQYDERLASWPCTAAPLLPLESSKPEAVRVVSVHVEMFPAKKSDQFTWNQARMIFILFVLVYLEKHRTNHTKHTCATVLMLTSSARRAMDGIDIL